MILHNIGHSVKKTSRIRSRIVKGLVSVSSRLLGSRSRSRLGGIFQCLGLVSVSAMKVSSASLTSATILWSLWLHVITHRELQVVVCDRDVVYRHYFISYRAFIIKSCLSGCSEYNQYRYIWMINYLSFDTYFFYTLWVDTTPNSWERDHAAPFLPLPPRPQLPVAVSTTSQQGRQE